MATLQKVKRCPGCHHTKFIQDMLALLGDLSCENCGMVQEENPIISEVQFGESLSGAAMVQGAMVGADQARANFSMRNAMELREQTLLSAKLKIRKLGSSMRIPEYIMESASGWFKLALVQNFVQGRRSQNVIAACLYVACRHERTHHLLIDFSLRLQISVYSLGATYLKLVRALQIQKLPLADPSLFIQHFAERLDFGDKTARICRDATQIALRMSHDWIYEGRRPAGIAGACLLLASRMNDQRRSHGEIVAIARVGEETIQKRLNEFKKTNSGGMTLLQFRESQATEASLPPSFSQNRNIELKITRLLNQRSRMLKQYKKLASRSKLFDALFELESDKRPVPKLESNSDVANQEKQDSGNNDSESAPNEEVANGELGEAEVNEETAKKDAEEPEDNYESAKEDAEGPEDNEESAKEDAEEPEDSEESTKDAEKADVNEEAAKENAGEPDNTEESVKEAVGPEGNEESNEKTGNYEPTENGDENQAEANKNLGANSDNSEDEDEIFDILPEAEEQPEPKDDQPYKPTTKRLAGLRTDFGLRTRPENLNYEEHNFVKEYEAMPARQASRKRRATPSSMAKKDGLLKSVLAGGDITEKELEVALDIIWKNQQKALKQALYQIPLESQARSLFVPEDEDRESSPAQGDDDDQGEDRLLQQIEFNRPRNLLKNLPTSESLLNKVSDDPNLGDELDDDVIAEMILTPEMSKSKEQIWTALNHEFLIAQEKRILKQAADEIAGNTSGQQRKRRRIKDTSMDPVLNDAAVANAISLIGEDGKAATPLESAKQLFTSKTFSKKINYGSINDLFNS